jgi:hypothetical protein
MLGILMALFAGPFAVCVTSLVQMFGGSGIPLFPEFRPSPSFTPGTPDIVLVVLILLVGAPVLESLAFPVLYWLTHWLPGQKVLFPTLIGVAAYVAHGAVVVNTTQALGFILMALWYAHLRERFPSPSLLNLRKIPYYGIVIAHFGWNATALLWPLTIALIARVMGS